jgi:hypothetical protein
MIRLAGRQLHRFGIALALGIAAGVVLSLAGLAISCIPVRGVVLGPWYLDRLAGLSAMPFLGRHAAGSGTHRHYVAQV